MQIHFVLHPTSDVIPHRILSSPVVQSIKIQPGHACDLYKEISTTTRFSRYPNANPRLPAPTAATSPTPPTASTPPRPSSSAPSPPTLAPSPSLAVPSAATRRCRILSSVHEREGRHLEAESASPYISYMTRNDMMILSNVALGIAPEYQYQTEGIKENDCLGSIITGED